MPVIPMLKAFSNDLVITPQESYDIVGAMIRGTITVVVMYSVIKIIETNLDLCEETRKPFSAIKKFV